MFHNLNIGVKLQLTIAVILFVASVVVVNWVKASFEEQMEKDIIHQAKESAIMSQNTLNMFMLTGMISDPDNRTLYFEKTRASEDIVDFRVIRSQEVSKVYGEGLPSEAIKDQLDQKVLNSAQEEIIRSNSEGKQTLRLVYPLKASKDFRGTDCTSCHTVPEGTVLGAISLTLDITEEIDSISQKVFYLWIGAGVLFVSMMVLVFFASNQFITKPLMKFENGLIAFFQFLNREKNTPVLLNEESNDEIGKMARVINENIQNTQKTIEEDNQLIQEAKNVVERVKHGWYSQQIQGHTSNKILEAFKNDVNSMIFETKKHFNDMNQILEEYAHLDYRRELVIDGIESGGVFELLLKDINKLRDSITQMLQENKSIGLTLQQSADKLLQNVDTLSTNSNYSAAALEETAAALEEVTSNTQQNTQNVLQMAKFASEVIKSAKIGQDLSTKTDLAMDQINEKVSSINEAITIIDQIAFQTNILSLNAAVEAATAGEAGKGFAVVAAEVRNLASRSAEAAKEIKELVEIAKEKANDGKSVAHDMTQGYEKLYENINNTIALINSVETASKEQQQAISQINDTINNLDKQTQQNATIAQLTKDIAVHTDLIAKEAVENVNKKEFVGKEEVKPKG